MENMIYMIGFTFIIIALIKVVPMLKDKKIDDNEKDQIQDIILDVVKRMLQLSTIKDYDSLKLMCIKEVQIELKENGNDKFTDEEIGIAVDLVLKTMLDKFEK